MGGKGEGIFVLIRSLFSFKQRKLKLQELEMPGGARGPWNRAGKGREHPTEQLLSVWYPCPPPPPTLVSCVFSADQLPPRPHTGQRRSAGSHRSTSRPGRLPSSLPCTQRPRAGLGRPRFRCGVAESGRAHYYSARGSEGQHVQGEEDSTLRRLGGQVKVPLNLQVICRKCHRAFRRKEQCRG